VSISKVKPVDVPVGVLAVADAGEDHGSAHFLDGVDDTIVAGAGPSE